MRKQRISELHCFEDKLPPKCADDYGGVDVSALKAEAVQFKSCSRAPLRAPRVVLDKYEVVLLFLECAPIMEVHRPELFMRKTDVVFFTENGLATKHT